MNRTILEAVISSVLTEEGIQPEKKGYHYLAYAIELAYRDRDMAGSVSKGIYPAVAEAFLTSPAAVERSMRTAIDGGCEDGRKSNSVFIFHAVEQVKIRLDKR